MILETLVIFQSWLFSLQTRGFWWVLALEVLVGCIGESGWYMTYSCHLGPFSSNYY